jgi:hypothetical protein
VQDAVEGRGRQLHRADPVDRCDEAIDRVSGLRAAAAALTVVARRRSSADRGLQCWCAGERDRFAGAGVVVGATGRATGTGSTRGAAARVAAGVVARLTSGRARGTAAPTRSAAPARAAACRARARITTGSTDVARATAVRNIRIFAGGARRDEDGNDEG